MLSDELRKSVLQAAVEGKLVPQNREDEPASVLLEKINEEKNLYTEKINIKEENQLSSIVENETPYELPENWAWVKLGKVILLISGRDLETSEYNSLNKGLPYITGASNIVDGQILINRWVENPKVISELDDLLISCKGTIGKTAINDIGDCHIARQIMSIRLFGDYIDKHYLKIFIDNYVAELERKAKSIIPGITRDDILSICFALPPIEEQKRIVSKVEELMAKIDEFETIEKELESIKSTFPEDMKKSLLHAAFQGKLTEQYSTDSSIDELLEEIKKEKEQLIKDKKFNGRKSFGPISEDEIPFDIPENWRWLRLVDCANMYTGNSIPEATKKAKYMGLSEGYNYIATKDVGFDSVIDYDNGVKIPKDEPKFKYAYKDASLLCIEGGSAGRKIGYLEETVCFGNKLCAFHPIVINSKYLYYYLQSPTFTDIFKDNITGIIGGVGINKLRSMIIPIPSLEEQERIVDKLEQLLPLCEDLVE